MYTEGVDEFNEAENRPARTYVSTGGQDSLKLQRENERLKKSLEKEQFFNRLLDQELKELKGSQEGANSYQSESDQAINVVSRGAFNIVLTICVVLAGFLAYTILFNKQYNLFSQSSPRAEMPEARSEHPAAAIKDSVPTIISNKKSTPAPGAALQQNGVASERKTATTARTTEAEKAPASKTQALKPKDEHIEKPVEAVAEPQPQEAVRQPDPVVTQPTPPAEKTAVGTYLVSSKANFYSAPDENTLRSYFISPGSDKVVNALEDKNGFIYVEFKNDIGYVTKGWLSKADLTKQ